MLKFNNYIYFGELIGIEKYFWCKKRLFLSVVVDIKMLIVVSLSLVLFLD